MIGYSTSNILSFAKSSRVCIVNAANRKLSAGGGVCGVIHGAAGPELEMFCKIIIQRRKKDVKPGSAVMTTGGLLPCKIMHAVGPVYQEYEHADACKLLAKTYTSILNLAKMHHVRGLVIPAISCGIYSFPIQDACRIAVTSVQYWNYMNPHTEMDIVLSAFDTNVATCYKNMDLIEIV